MSGSGTLHPGDPEAGAPDPGAPGPAAPDPGALPGGPQAPSPDTVPAQGVTAHSGLQALASAPISIAAFAADGTLRFANAELLRQLDLPPETDLVGRGLADMLQLCAFRGFLGAGDPEELAREALALDRAQPLRRTVRARDGRWFDLVSEPLPDGGFASYATDVSQHRRGVLDAEARAAALEMAVRHQDTGLGLYDATHRLVRHNDGYERTLGLQPGTLRSGMTLAEVHRVMLEHHAYDPLVRNSVDERGRLDRTRPHEEVRPLPDGRAVRNSSRPLPSGGFLVTVEDVTALRRAEDEARHRAATLRGVVAALPYGICVYDANQRLTMVNEAYQSILRGAELTVGEHLIDVCRRREAAGEYPPGVTAEQIYRQQFEVGPPRLRKRADGTMLSVRSARLPDGGLLIVVADLTALHIAEATAKQRADLLQAMIDNTPYGICLFGADHRLVARNELAVHMMGLPPGMVGPGLELNELRALQHAAGGFGQGPEADALLQLRSAMDLSQPQHFLVTRADGRKIDVHSAPTPDGGFVRTYTDVTEEHRIRGEIERARRGAEDANSAKTRFLATMSHELRTPLNAVIGFSEALLADEQTAGQGREFSAAILEAGRHLLSLIDDILQVAQVGSGELPVETRALHLPSVLESAVRLVRTSAQEAQVDVVLEPPPDTLPRAQAEERRLRQVLLNLLSNAVKFTPAGGAVHLSAAALPDGGVEVTVTDTGIGIEPAQLHRAFEPFVQLETTHDRRYGGSGLGLYLARAFARAMGGELTLESARGAGTTARLRLAAATPNPEPTA
ncbi:PAS-domain containing protein [Roseomonas haemaphysalidis]|uniref:histidine kinase n=1 Tax=Roseomonas haemaphysalidis TaxID=2768162 RepID=A0ABS3KQM3_9PROT|nr:PAS-domain containing protein [Roseomonas haemaphysalidis]MBO1079751.1 PAS-domain containing protein [Roseomonas haemaphysalidis]